MKKKCKNMPVPKSQHKGFRHLMYGVDTKIKMDDGRCDPAVNLDNAATTPAFKGVITEIKKRLCCYGSIGRGKGQKSEKSTEVYTQGREKVKQFFGAASDIYTVFYSNNTTDGMNKLASALITSPDDIILTTRMEHHANDLPWRERAQTVYADVDALGRLKISDIENLLKQYNGQIKYVTVTAASNVTGYVNDVHKIARMAHQYGALMIVDGAQIAAHRQFSLLGSTPEENIDFFLFSAHKMYSPFGGGGVIGRADVLNAHLPKFYGGGMVDAVCDNEVKFLPAPDSYEAGSPNYPGVVGMLEAMRIIQDEIGFDYLECHEHQLLARTISGLSKIPGVTLYGDNINFGDRVGIVTFNIAGFSCSETADILAHHFGIATRHAAFCAHPYVRRLMGEPVDGPPCEVPEGMVRASFGIYTSTEEVDYFIRAVREIAHDSKIIEKIPNRMQLALHHFVGRPYDRG